MVQLLVISRCICSVVADDQGESQAILSLYKKAIDFMDVTRLKSDV